MTPIQKQLLSLALVLFSAAPGFGQTKPRTVVRLFWQDAADQSLRWGDVQQADTWSLAAETLTGFPKLDADKQAHVQMQVSEGMLLTAIHDTQEGAFQSGWVAVDTGVTKEEHGDHFHWHFNSPPVVRATRLDDQQGNPAHVYNYDGNFYLANDKKNGVTQVTVAGLRQHGGQQADRFISAGGGHITLAAVNNSVVYSTWIDREGDKLGQVDVVGLGSAAQSGYSFHLPSGGIHGATANSGRVFFAPADGICWVTADPTLSTRPQDVQVNHLAIGVDPQGTPLRTGAFTNHRNFVLFNTGRGETSKLCWLDAASPKPSIGQLELKIPPGASAGSPVAVRTRSGDDYALIFQECTDASVEEKLLVIELDPNRDGLFSDAKVARSLAVGASLIEGHSGHHELTTIAGNRFVVLTNPGDGTIWIVSLADWSVTAKFKVGGAPTRVVAVGS